MTRAAARSRVVGGTAGFEHRAVDVGLDEHAEHAGQLEGQREGRVDRVGVADGDRSAPGHGRQHDVTRVHDVVL